MSPTRAVVNLSSNFPARETAGQALRVAGLEVVEARGWDEVREKLGTDGAALVVCDRDAVQSLGAAGGAIPRDTMRKLSHELRTPLSAMAGWLHLLEMGKLDEAGLKKAITKLRGNIDDQVKTIDRYLGATQEGQR